jgi:hypothetical protein
MSQTSGRDGNVSYLGSNVGLLQHAPHPLLVFLNVMLSKSSTSNEELGVLGQRCRLVLDGLVHPRLGEGRLVCFIVPVTTVADNVDDNILLPFGPVVSSQLAHKVDRLDIVAVDVEDGGINGFGNVRWVWRGTREARIRGKSDLVVHDEMDGSC